VFFCLFVCFVRLCEQVKFGVFVEYFKASSYLMSFLLIFFYIFSNVASVGSNFWLAAYSNTQGKNDSNTTISV